MVDISIYVYSFWTVNRPYGVPAVYGNRKISEMVYQKDAKVWHFLGYTQVMTRCVYTVMEAYIETVH